MRGDVVRLHGLLAESRANGPGRRAVVWFQGCTLGCKGCFNPQTHDPGAGEPRRVGDLAEKIAGLAPGLSGLTVSGGEPFQQPEALETLLAEVRARTALSVLVFSGYRLEEILGLPRGRAILGHVDVLVAGRYVPARPLGRRLLGSANQTVHFLSDRHAMADLGAVPEAEVQIDALGRVAVTGVAPPRLSGGADPAGGQVPSRPAGRRSPRPRSGPGDARCPRRRPAR